MHVNFQVDEKISDSNSNTSSHQTFNTGETPSQQKPRLFVKKIQCVNRNLLSVLCKTAFCRRLLIIPNSRCNINDRLMCSLQRTMVASDGQLYINFHNVKTLASGSPTRYLWCFVSQWNKIPFVSKKKRKERKDNGCTRSYETQLRSEQRPRKKGEKKRRNRPTIHEGTKKSQ